MKRTLGAALVLGVSLVVASFQGVPTFAAGTNNFSISSYDISYELSTTQDNHSLLTTKETITAEFPDSDENHGLERFIPTSYKGDSLRLNVVSVTNQSGTDIAYSKTDNEDAVRLRIGDADTYVHGTQTYVITYTQQDVTKYFADTAVDEWYWDTNGTGWAVPIDELTVTAKIDYDLSLKMKTDPICYFGYQGSDGGDNTDATGDCEVTSIMQGVYYASERDVRAGQNITLNFGFPANTFAAYEAPPFNLWAFLIVVWGVVQFFASGLAFACGVLIVILATRRSNRAKELKPIPVQYIPPTGASVLTSQAVYMGASYNPFAAQLIDLAVRHFITIIETKPKAFLSAAEYDIEVIQDVTPLLEEEREILSDMFGHEPKVGERLALKSLKSNMAYIVRTTDNVSKLQQLITGRYGLRGPSEEVSKWLKKWATAMLVIGILLVSPAFLIIALATWIGSKFTKPLTDKGLALRRYVFGLKTYINSTEKERLAFLQGPDTAEKIGYAVDANDQSQIVKLYERTLPYAILFNAEKEWSKRLGDFYQNTQSAPDWYRGSTPGAVFNAVAFSSVLSNFSQASASSSGYSSSSSSGGSGGGGFSGGGGGGGGGGGW